MKYQAWHARYQTWHAIHELPPLTSQIFTNGTPYLYWNEILYCTKYIRFVIRLFMAVVTCRCATSQMSFSNILKSVEKRIEPLLWMLIICFHNDNTLWQIYVSWGVHYHRTDDCMITRAAFWLSAVLYTAKPCPK